MMLRITILFIAGLISQLQGQDLYMKLVSETKGMPFGGLAKSTTHMYLRKGQSKVEMNTIGGSQTVFTGTDSVMVVSPGLCGIFSREELANDGLNPEIEYKDLKIAHSGEVKTLLGYQCSKVVMTYKVKLRGEYSYEDTYWYTKDIVVPDNSDLPSVNKPNQLTEEIKKIGGVVLLIESTMKTYDLKTTTKVTEVKTEKIDENVFSAKDVKCKKPKNLEEYKKELEKQQRQAASHDQFHQNFSRQFSYPGGF